MSTLWYSGKSLFRLAFVLTLAGAFSLGVSGSRVIAQEMAMASHPAHLHTGTCDAPGDVVFPLTNVGFDYSMDGTPMAGEMIGATSAIPVESSQTTVAASLSDIAAGGHTLVVHESDENIQNYIACGDVGGGMMGPSDLAIGLGALNDSGYSGVAWLRDNGDGTTMVTIFLTGASMGMDSGMDMGGESAMGAETAVTIEGFAFNPATIEISVGDSVTWTNNDSTPHTVTQSPSGSGFQSGSLAQGTSFTQTFDAAGTYDYFCEFHANMTGTVIVS
ncbi:MAG: cupredoxin family copper-binding protein [Thermomicrobiales bacterium]